jgi:hypothetical protein
MAIIDLNSRTTLREAFSNSIVEKIDQAIESEQESPRHYIGASAVGDECERRVQLDVWPAFHPGSETLPFMRAVPFSGRTRRIFARGHWGEQVTAGYMMEAGFDLRIHRGGEADSVERLTPYGFITGRGQIRGNLDGIVFGMKDINDLTSINFPCVWEHKTLGQKTWKAIAKHGLAKESPKYADQIAMYQAYTDNQNPALFSALNADTMELWFELVAFDAVRAQAASDRAVKILQWTRAGDLLPKAATSEDSFPCSFCRRRAGCWGDAGNR